MKNIYFRDGILIYYGNPAGYLSEGKVVLDSIFDKEEIIAFLSEKEKLQYSFLQSWEPHILITESTDSLNGQLRQFCLPVWSLP